ncbi:MAG TPA: CS1 fimbrial subunit B flags: Precursor [Dyella sp.]|uniref:CS1 fimbrial subunit B flags: Precursor n=1 Tax=Dyella sp. TaxID=1869338 RepID=UPI002F9428E1
MLMRIFLITTVLAAYPIAHAASPGIHIGSLYEFLDPGKQTLLKRIRNSGDATAFVRVEISEIVYNENDEPSEIPIDKARIGGDDPTRHAVVSSPDRLIIRAGGRYATRLIHEGNRDRERYYRVRFIPVLPEKPEEFGLNEKEAADYGSSLQAGVKVVIGYGMTLIARPNQVRYDTQLGDHHDEYIVANQGNTTLILDNYQDCKGVNDCTDYRRIYIRPGHQEHIAKESGHTYQFLLKEGDLTRSIAF